MKSVIFLLFCINLALVEINGATFHNPILSSSSPDPFVARHGNSYYMVLSDSHRLLSVLQSNILTDWRNATRKVVYTAPSTMDNLYAPELHLVRGEWYIYFTMDDGLDENHRMHVLQADDPSDPAGNYTYLNQITLESEDYFAIDGTPLDIVSPNGQDRQLYFIWSGWPEATLGGKPYGANMYIAKMSNATTISGPRALLKEPEAAWEGTVVEGPEILKSPFSNRTFIIYSAANTWDETYCLSLLSLQDGQDPMVPSNWEQLFPNPLFVKNTEEGVFGPGHASFTTSPDGTESWVVYHAMDASLNGSNRTARAQKFTWELDGTPNFGKARGFNVELNVPSGQASASL